MNPDTLLETRVPAESRSLAELMVAQTAGSVRAVLLYGSHMLRANPDAHSAYDFVVVVGSYEGFYAALKETGQLRRPVWLMVALSSVLPPNAIAFAPEERGALAKCLVVSDEHLEQALGAEPKDHFLLGRLVQKVGLVWSADAAAADWIERCLADARSRVLEWMAPYLDGPVDARDLGRRILQVCYQGEVRPEAKDRSDLIFQAQEDHFDLALTPVLRAALATGTFAEVDGKYRLAKPVPLAVVRRWRRHFRRSKLRATLRWFKHTATFDNWLPYVVRKAERHSGQTIELTRLERRLPLIFLWPRAIRFLLSRPSRGSR